jgi:hypothetical protein
MERENAAALANLKAHLDTKEFRGAIKDARLERPEEFRLLCLKFCDDLYDTAAAAWTENFDTDNGWEPKFTGFSLIEHYPALQSCWLGDIRSAIVEAASSKETDQETRDFFYFMLGIVCDAWDMHIRKPHGEPT